MSTTMLKSLIATLALESQEEPKTIAEEAVADVAAEKVAEAEKAATAAAAAPTDTLPTDPAAEPSVTEEEVEKVEDVTQALESLCLMMESAVKSGKGYSRLELALHDTAVVGHCKRLEIQPPLRPSLESVSVQGADAETQLVLASLESYVEKLQEVALEARMEFSAEQMMVLESGGFLIKLKEHLVAFFKFISKKIKEIYARLKKRLDSYNNKRELEQLLKTIKEKRSSGSVPTTDKVDVGFFFLSGLANGHSNSLEEILSEVTRFTENTAGPGSWSLLSSARKFSMSDISEGKAPPGNLHQNSKERLPGNAEINYDTQTAHDGLALAISAVFTYTSKDEMSDGDRLKASNYPIPTLDGLMNAVTKLTVLYDSIDTCLDNLNAFADEIGRKAEEIERFLTHKKFDSAVSAVIGEPYNFHDVSGYYNGVIALSRKVLSYALACSVQGRMIVETSLTHYR